MSTIYQSSYQNSQLHSSQCILLSSKYKSYSLHFFGSSTSIICSSCLGSFYLVGDCKQLEKVQRRAARFVKRDYKSMTSVSSLISQLGWQTLSGRGGNSRLSLMYKSLHGLTCISTSPFRRPSKTTRSADYDTFFVLSSRVDPYKYSFYPRTTVDWNALPASVKSRPSIHSFRCAIRSSSTNSI